MTPDRCEHGRERRLCPAVHYTPEQARAYVRAITSSPDARAARDGRPVPKSLL